MADKVNPNEGETRPRPNPKLPPNAPPGAKYVVGNIFVDDYGQEVKPTPRPPVQPPATQGT